jgi:hypothetical protein
MTTIFVLSPGTDELLGKTGLLQIEPFELNAWNIMTILILSRFNFTIAAGW